MKKKLIISVLSLAIIGTSGALVYSAQKQKIEKPPITSNTDDKTSDSISEKTETTTKNTVEPITEKPSAETKDSEKVESSKQELPKESDKTTSATNPENSNSEKESNKSEDIKKENNKPENTKNNSATSKPSDTQTNQPKPEQYPSTSFTSGLTRENLNGYYKITRSDGGIGYGKLTNAGLFTLDQRPSGTVFTSTDKFTSKSSGGGNKFEFQLNGEMTNSSFTVKDADELNVNMPNFGDADSYVYKRISQSEYEKGAQSLIVRENKFSTLGDYYFGNKGYVGTMSSVESTVKINGKEYKIVKSHQSDERVIISLFGQTYNYKTYKSSGSLVADNSDMYSGFN